VDKITRVGATLISRPSGEPLGWTSRFCSSEKVEKRVRVDPEWALRKSEAARACGTMTQRPTSSRETNIDRYVGGIMRDILLLKIGK